MIVVIYTTVATEDQAKEIAITMLQEQLVACTNYWPTTSHFIWEEKLQQKNEVAMYLKTSQSNQEAVYHRLLALHPYDCPAIISLQVEQAHLPFADWVTDVVHHKKI